MATTATTATRGGRPLTAHSPQQPPRPHNRVDPRPGAEHYDVIVIGAGVVGCAVARHFTLHGAKTLVVEKGADILAGASKGNTALLHNGFDAPPGSVEQACLRDGYDEYLRIRARLNLPLLETGALALAWTREEAARLEQTLARAHINGITAAKMLTAKQALAREPQLAPAVLAGIDIPGECVIDPWSTPYAYLLQSLENGARLMRDCETLGGRFDGREWRLATTRGALRGGVVINCAGLYADRVEAALIGQSAFTIRPRKGQFLVYEKAASRLLNAIIFPPPRDSGKGVILCRTIFGNLLVGPSSEEQDSRSDASNSAETLRRLRRRGEAMLPALARYSITATYAGIRPATEFSDYCIRAVPGKNYLSVGGIRSTGLSAALGIARYVHRQYMQLGTPTHCAPAGREIVWPRAPSLAEHRPRDWQSPGNGGIVCHCELVTTREIQRALRGKLPAASLGGLKRRTRATLGACQGFYCYARLSELTRGCFAEDLAVSIPGGDGG